ncbi:MAG: membrane protein [Burkholderiaceae bacterium]|nr:membrane protein [Burkholderiaceae bacterium]
MVRRLIYLLLGIAISGVSIAAVAQAGLGISPISTLPFVLSKISDYSFGAMNFAVNLIFVLLQILLLRKDFKLFALLQIPFVFLFSCSIDVGMWIVAHFSMTTYAVQLTVSIVGCFFMALAIGLMVCSNLLMMPGDGFVLALSTVTGKAYGTLKMANDILSVLLAALIGWLFLDRIEGIREGTLISAFLVGYLLRHLMPILKPLLTQKHKDE